MATFFRDARVDQVYRYWLERRGARAAPRRSDINPLDIPRLLPILNLVDVLGDAAEFRHRLVGTQLVDRHGRDPTGKYVDAENYGPFADDLAGLLRRVTRSARPHRLRTPLDWNDRPWLAFESAELPLIDNSGRVIMVLRAASFFEATELDGRTLEHVPVPLP